MLNSIKHVTIIGAGTMGSSIAQWFTEQFIWVDLVDTTIEASEKAKEKVFNNWDKLLEKEKFTGCQIGQFKQFLNAKDKSQIDPKTDLVIEAIFENLEIKKELFIYLDQYCESHTVFASNTSSFPIHLMSTVLKPDRKRKFLGLHFFNPATIMKLVEIIKTNDTDEDLSKFLYQWFKERKKEPALCADSPGFIVNRVARNFYGEALRIVQKEDTKKMKEVDKIMREVGGFKMGPFELMDLIGIDVNLAVTESVWKLFHEETRFSPHELQKKMVSEKRFGKKTKRGFYEYE